MPKTKTEDAALEVQDALEEFVEFPYMGTTFVIPRDRDDWSTEGLAHLAEERYNLFVKYTLEVARPGQWDLVCRICPRKRDYAGFFKAFGAATQECIN